MNALIPETSSLLAKTKLSTEIARLKKEIDNYTLRYKRVNNACHNFECEIEKFAPSVYCGKFIFQNMRIDTYRDAVTRTEEKIETAKYVAERYRRMIGIYSHKREHFYIRRQYVPRAAPTVKRKSVQPVKFTLLHGSPAFALPPIHVDHLKKEESNRYPKHVRVLMRSCRIILKYFSVGTGEEVIAEMRKRRRINAGLNEAADELKEQLPNLRQCHGQLKAFVDQLEGAKLGHERMLQEGSAYHDTLLERLQFEDNECKEISEQNLALTKSIKLIGERCQLEPVKNEDGDNYAALLRRITSFVRNNPKVLSALHGGHDRRRKGAIADSPSMKLMVIPEDGIALPYETEGSDFQSDGSQNALGSVPQLTFNAAASSGYVPGTRSTRRAFSALPSLRTQDVETGNAEQEMLLIGTIIGNSLVERYASEFMRFRVKITAASTDCDMPTDVTVPEGLSEQPAPKFLGCVFDLYKQYHAYLHLLVFDNYEISMADKSFLDFIAKRDEYIEEFKRRPGHVDLFQKHWQHMLLQDENVACWVAHDFVRKTEVSELVAIILRKMTSTYQRKQAQIKTTMELSDASEYIPWIACFMAFLDVKNSTQLEASVTELVHDNTSNLIPIFAKSQRSAVSRAGMLVSFGLGRYLPHIYQMHIGLQKKATSTLHDFIRVNIDYPSCVAAGTQFFAAARRFLDVEAILWHTVIFFHGIVSEIARSKLRVANLNSYLAVMTTIVANRQLFTQEQLVVLHFLPWIISNFQLEEFMCNSKKSHVHEVKEPTTQAAPQGQVSYLDIPALPMVGGMPSLNLENPKLQLHFKPTADPTWKPNATAISENEYLVKRHKYPIYVTKNTHCHFAQLMFATLIDHSLHKLDVNVCDPFPHVNRKPNILYTLMRHMESKHNEAVVRPLAECFTPPVEDMTAPVVKQSEPIFKDSGRNKNQMRRGSENVASGRLESVQEEPSGTPSVSRTQLDDDPFAPRPMIRTLSIQSFRSTHNFIALIGPEDGIDETPEQTNGVFNEMSHEEHIAQFADYKRLLRLSVPSLFNPDVYANGTHIASGAFGAVMAVTLDGQLYAVKVLEKSRHEFDNPHLVEVFTEVSILEGCKSDRRISQIVDYGCTQDSYYIVMEFYPSTMKSWRKQFSSGDQSPPADVLLRLYREFLKCCTVLTERRINHFDIKCDNVMLDRAGMPAIADFGEAMTYNNENTCFTLLNKGTEWIKSPEMLSIALNSSATNPGYDRRRKVGAGPASDIWSMGCLFFELITGEFLFVDSDWSRFFLRITNANRPLLSDKNKELLKDPNYVSFLEFVLQRSVRNRPDMKQVLVKFDEMFPNATRGALPQPKMPVFSSDA